MKQGCKAAAEGTTCSYPSCKCDVPLPRTMEQKAERLGETRTVEYGLPQDHLPEGSS